MCKKHKKSNILCSACLDVDKNVYLVPTGKIFMTHPLKRVFKCPHCGYKEIVEEKQKTHNQ